MMLELSVDSEKNHARFVRRVVESQRVWAVEGNNGVIPFESSHAGGHVLPFWSDEAYARRAARRLGEGELLEIGLFDFLFRWLNGMSEDGVLVGTNWSAGFAGKELPPEVLQEEILDTLEPSLRSEYFTRLSAALEAHQE
jgi:hypothetical protein